MIDRIKSKIFNRKGARYSFSQAGEDLILQRIFLGINKGLFVDIGAYHPYRLSNTYLFYASGWRGINIESRPGSKRLFDKVRPEDINLEIGIAEHRGSANYYMFEESTLNRFEFSDSLKTEETPSRVVTIEVKPLSEVFQDHLGSHGSIDFMTIDTEGGEYHVLRSNNWERFRARVVLIEQNINNPRFVDVADFLNGLGYREAYRVPVNSDANSVFFLDKQYA
jgi:FkbM family methyltransferase